MNCPSCGRELNDDVNFCYYCGHSFRDGGNTANTVSNRQPLYTSAPPVSRGYIEPENPVNDNDTSVNYDAYRADRLRKEQESSPMSTVAWVLYFACLLIPFLWIVWLIITCVWAFGKKGTTERRNLARAMLISIVLLLVIIVAYLSVMISKYGADGTIERLTNGMYKSVDDYMNHMGK